MIRAWPGFAAAKSREILPPEECWICKSLGVIFQEDMVLGARKHVFNRPPGKPFDHYTRTEL